MEQGGSFRLSTLKTELHCHFSADFRLSTLQSPPPPLIQPRHSLFLLSCQHLTAVCMHIFSFTYTFSWHMHAHIHRHTCLRHTRTQTHDPMLLSPYRFCSSFPLAEFPFPLFSALVRIISYFWLFRFIRTRVCFRIIGKCTKFICFPNLLPPGLQAFRSPLPFYGQWTIFT